jgi:hypothetical protein
VTPGGKASAQGSSAIAKSSAASFFTLAPAIAVL